MFFDKDHAASHWLLNKYAWGLITMKIKLMQIADIKMQYALVTLSKERDLSFVICD